MGARPYDPTIGRFLAVDPIDGGSLNNYDYAGQDPINGYDLNGTCWTGFCWAAHAAQWTWSGLKTTAPIALPIFITAAAAAACGGCSILVASVVIGGTSGATVGLADKFLQHKSTKSSLVDAGINVVGGSGQEVLKAAVKDQVEKLLVQAVGQKAAATLQIAVMFVQNSAIPAPVRGRAVAY
jgi:hypothetical protein